VLEWYLKIAPHSAQQKKVKRQWLNSGGSNGLPENPDKAVLVDLRRN
jgi:hypothetical protein